MAQDSIVALDSIRFDCYELDTAAGELRKNGQPVKLEGQPIQILSTLLEHPGAVVSREELRRRMWPANTFVDFEHGINTSIKRLRQALQDSAESPRYIETLPRRGYRFIYPLGSEVIQAPGLEPSRRRGFPGTAALSIVGLIILLISIYLARFVHHSSAQGSVAPLTSIAVLPFENLSGNSADDYFADGFTEELITDLSKVSSLRVTSRTSVMRYKRTQSNVKEIAKELGVQRVIEGSVAREGKRVRITVQLLDAATDTHVWSERYDRDLRSMLSLQGEVTWEVARRVRAQLSPQEQARLSERQPVDPEAYEMYLKGRYFQSNWTAPGNLQNALHYYQQAIDREPHFASAQAGLAMTYLLTAAALIEETTPQEVMKKSRAAATAALEYDPYSSEAYEALGWLAHNHEWNWSAAEQAYERAIELNPNYAPPHTWFGHYLQTLGRQPEAIRQMEIAHRLDPLSPHIHWSLAESLMLAGEMDGAIKECKEAIRLHPDFWPLSALLGNMYLWQGKNGLAIYYLRNAVKISGRHPYSLGMLASGYALSGQSDMAQTLLRELVRRSKQEYVSPMVLVRVYASLGNKQMALHWLRVSERARLSEVPRVRLWGPAVASLQNDPEFQGLLRRLNLPAPEQSELISSMSH